MRAFEAALAAAGNPPAPEPTPPDTSAPEVPDTTAPPAPTTTAPPDPTTTAPAPTTTAPPPTTVPPVSGGILDVLAEAGQFTQLLAAIDAAGLTETLSGPGPFTLFAPTDEAFGQAGSLPTEPEALQALLLYHVVEDDLTAFELMGLGSVATAQGGEVAISVDAGQIVLNEASTVTITNVLGSNGVVHVVNAVLVPPG
jgi:uncharacterized surface protein with fasciclin (FAS1) repeats